MKMAKNASSGDMTYENWTVRRTPELQNQKYAYNLHRFN